MQKKNTELELEEKNKLNEFIQNKKEVFISKFLKGYSHQESILKTLEGKIKGYFINLPNLIFKKSNDDGKTIEEIDQIYLVNLESEKLTIDGFNYFYFAKYSDGQKIDSKIFPNGTNFELVNNNLYFLEIKNSINGLILDYDKLKNSKINRISNQSKTISNDKKSNDKNSKDKKSKDKKSKSKNSQISIFYKRDELTGLGNAILTFKVFQELIREILEKKEKECNLLYIVDSDFEKNMINIFENCLERDKIIIEDHNLSFNLYLIYTQPDLALKHFIKESWEKKNLINLLTENLNKKNEELEKKNAQIEKQNEEIRRQNEKIEKLWQNRIIEKLQHKAIYLDNSIIEFVKKKIQNNNMIVLIGLYEKINNNQTYIYTSLDFFQGINSEKKITLVDFKTFNKAEQQDLDKRDEIFIKYLIEDYQDKVNHFNWFNEIYIMVDLIFLQNIRLLIEKEIFETYELTIYMIKQDKFIIYMKKVNFTIQLIKIYNDESENPLFKKYKNHEDLQLFEIEQFVSNYTHLLKLRNFCEKKCDKFLDEKFYLFDLKGRINYILDICKNVNNNAISKNCFILIISAKEVNNSLYDKFINNFVAHKEYKNIFILRKTEFGNSFSKEELISILSYYFNIDNDFKCENRITWEDDIAELYIDEESFKKYGIIRLIEHKSMLPIYPSNGNKINCESIAILEYFYFVFLPILIKKDSKPKVLIIADDYGILNNYYKSIYDDKLDVSFISLQNKKNEDRFIEKIEIENDNKINANSEEEALKQLFINEVLFDIIIVEKMFNKIEDETSIPSFKDDYRNLLDSNGIFCFNLRSCSLNEHKKEINNIKTKFKNIKIINFRLCSDFLICSKNNNMKMDNDFPQKYPKLLTNYELNLREFLVDIGELNN